MGVGASSRGSRIVARDTDARMPAVQNRADREAFKDEIAVLRERLAASERDLARARRCLAAERRGREQLRLRLAAANSAYSFGVSTLCRIAFPSDAAPGEAQS